MAIYHLSAKIISRSSGRSATGAAAYRAGQEITDERTGLVHDYTRKGGVDHTEILTPANAPEWAHDRAKLWNGVEAAEKRKDAQLCREVEVALPCELTPEQMRDLVREFVRAEFVERGMVADVALHHVKSENPHAHILLTTRDIGPDGFGQKNRDWNRKELLEEWRESWERHANLALERAGHEARIDHRTLAAQGIQREPSPHLGPKAHGYEQRTCLPSNVRQLREAANAPRAALAVEIQQAEASVVELEAQLSALEREQRQQQRRAALLARILDHDHALARLPLFPTVQELARHLHDWPEQPLRERLLEQLRAAPLSIPTTGERRKVTELQMEHGKVLSALRDSVNELCAERDERQRRSWFRRLFDKRLPSVLQQIADIESRSAVLRTEQHCAILQAQAAAEAADNAARVKALATREQAIQQAIEAALALPLVDDSSPPKELARAAPAPATPEPPRLRRSR